MPELATLQALFSAAMARPAEDRRVVPLVAGDEGLARRRLAIYRANIAANFSGALGAIYPIVGKLVGEEFFAGLAHSYCAVHPSASGDLNEFGEHFAEFLSTFAPAQALPYLPDVARLEWLAHKAHYAANHPPLAIDTLADLADDDFALLAVKLHPAVAVVHSVYPLLKIWEVHQDDYGPEIAVDLGNGGGDCIVYRPEFRATVAALSAGEAAFIGAVARGERLGPALNQALNDDPAFDFPTSLKKWALANIVVELRAVAPK